MNLKDTVRKIIAKKLYIFNKLDRKKMVDRYVEDKKDDDRSSVPDEPTFWTCFKFKGHTPDDFHCTHKFFGELKDDDVKEVIDVLDTYFESKPFKSFKTLFNKEKFFGENKDVRVLTPKKFKEEDFLLDLKKQLDGIVPDKYKKYKPHVTTDLPVIDLPIESLLFQFGDSVLKEYKEKK